MSSLPDLIQADAYTYNEMDQARGQASYKLWPDDFTPIKGADEILGRFAGQIPMHAQWNRGDGQALKISDFLSPREFQSKEIYNEFYRPMRIPHTIGIALPVTPQCLVTIGSHRGRKDFTERERTALNLIQPHVLQAYANAEAVTLMQAELARLNQAIEQMPQGLASVDAHGAIQWATDRGRALLRTYFNGRRKSPLRLPDSLVRWIRCSQTGLNHAVDQPHSITPLIIDRGTRQLHLRMVPEKDHILLFLEESSTEVRLEPLAHFGLSRRETETLSWIARGKSNPEIATLMSISVRTIHKHVEHIYLKLGVENRHAAMTLAMEEIQRRQHRNGRL